jgi:transcriptional regulator with XRE-family HTH domain
MEEDGSLATPERVLARQLKYWRDERKLSAQALANRLAELGAPGLNRRVIAKIENSERGVSLDEWLQLAHALAVPPPLLFLDLRSGSEVRITDSVVLHPWLAWEWIQGEHPPVMTDRTVARVEEFARAKHAIFLYRHEVKAASAVQDATHDLRRAEFVGDSASMQEARARYAAALTELARCFDDMVENGIQPPGVISRWLDDMRGMGLLRHPDRVTVFEPGASADGESDDAG